MLGGDDTEYNRNQERIATMRKREEERRLRMLNAKQRTLGVDLNALEAMRLERKKLREQERESAAQQLEEEQAIRRHVMGLEQQQAEERARERIELANEWRDAMIRKPVPKKEGALDPDRCGPSAAQGFQGEDPLRNERMAKQAAQMRAWCLQQQSEHQQRRQADRDEELAYADFLRQVDRARETLEAEDYSQRVELNMQVRDTNMRLAREKRAADKSLKTQADLEARQEQEAFEARQRAAAKAEADANTSRASQMEGVMVANYRAIEAKRVREQLEAEEERKWANHARATVRLVAEAEHADAEARAKEAMAVQQDILAQRREAKQRERKAREDAHGAIGDGFFQGFGRSAR